MAGGEGPPRADADGEDPTTAPLLTPGARHAAPRTKQYRFSLQVEKIPVQLRSNAALFAYFNAMFPGKVHSARVAMNVPDLDALSARRVRVRRRLEKSLAYFQTTGRRPVHVAGRPRCRCCGIESVTISLPGEVKDIDDTSEAHEVYESLPGKGEVVDSIQYYTLELAICNQRLHELQKEKLLIAETGRSPRGGCPDNEDDVWYSDPLEKIKFGAAAAAEGLREEFEVSGEEDYLGDIGEGYGAISCCNSPDGATLAGTEAKEARLNLVVEDHLADADKSLRNKGSNNNGKSEVENVGDDAREREKKRRRNRPHLKLRACLWRMGFDFLAAGLDEVRRNTDVVVDSVTRPSMSSTGFVTFRTLMPVTVTTSSPLTYKQDPMEVKVAPEPRDLVWQNVPIDKDIGSSRAFFADTLLGLGVLLWSIPLTLIQAWAKIENVALIPGLEWVAKIQNVALKQFINGYLPVVALLGLILLLPLIFQWVATSYEKRKTFSGVQSSIIGRYFYYQLANIYITVTAGALWTSAANIINNPQKLLVILGQTFPRLAGYFISLLITKSLVGLPTTLLRVGALSRLIFLRGCFREKWLTERELKEVVFRKLPLQYGWEYPTLFLVIIICFNYACITPVVLPAGAVYFFIALLVYKKQAMHVYTPTYESGGKMFPQAVTKTLLALFISQLTLIGYYLIRKNVFQIILLAPLPFMTIFFMQFVQHRYFDHSKKLSLERAIQISHSQEFSDDMFSAEAYQQPVLTEKASVPMCSLCEPGVEN